MSAALALSAAGAEAQGGSSAVLSDAGGQLAAQPFCKSAKIVTHPRLTLARAKAVLRTHAREVIYGAFPAPSRHQTCLDAARACGTSPATILRLIEGDTASPDVLVLGYCARLYRDRTGRDTPVHAVLAQIINLEGAK